MSEQIVAKYQDLSPDLKMQIDTLIPQKDGRRKFCRTDLIKIMAWCYRMGVLESGDDIVKIVMDETIEDKSDVAAKISLYYSQQLAKMKTIAGQEMSELGKLCTLMQNIAAQT